MAQRPGGEKRGNSQDRAARRTWLLSTFGDGEQCACVLMVSEQCAVTLTDATVEADRIEAGGSYRRDNIQPACRACNLARSDAPLVTA